MLGLLDGLGDGPEVRAAVDVPLCVARGLRRKGVVSVGGVVVRMQLVAGLAEVRVGVLLTAKDVVDPSIEASSKLSEEVHVAVGGRINSRKLARKDGNMREI